MRPRIAITTWRRELPTFVGPRTRLYTLADEYVRFVSEAGATPLLVPHLRAEEADNLLDAVDGLLVAGGGDVDPHSYGAPNTASGGIGREGGDYALDFHADLKTLQILEDTTA